jgi:tetratricopeptide (TPR) repeat protein
MSLFEQFNSKHNICYINNEHIPYIDDFNKILDNTFDYSQPCDNPIILNFIGLYYDDENKDKNKDKAIEYYLKAIKFNNVYAMSNLANIYWGTHRDYVLAEKYYLMAVDNGNHICCNKLGKLYSHLGKMELAIKYYLTGIKYGSILALNNLKTSVTELKLYMLLMNIDTKNDLINNTINELKKTKEIICFENKKNLLNKDGECMICFEDTKLIPKECCHYYCCDCYVKYSKCSICDF